MYSGESWCGSNLFTSISCRSKLEQYPSTSSSATARPTPAECVTQTASATQNPDTCGDSPSSGMLSVVNENSPLKPSSTFASRVDGSRIWVCFQASAKSSSVKSSTD